MTADIHHMLVEHDDQGTTRILWRPTRRGVVLDAIRHTFGPGDTSVFNSLRGVEVTNGDDLCKFRSTYGEIIFPA